MSTLLYFCQPFLSSGEEKLNTYILTIYLIVPIPLNSRDLQDRSRRGSFHASFLLLQLNSVVQRMVLVLAKPSIAFLRPPGYSPDYLPVIHGGCSGHLPIGGVCLAYGTGD